jgi:hypothetical protein
MGLLLPSELASKREYLNTSNDEDLDSEIQDQVSNIEIEFPMQLKI